MGGDDHVGEGQQARQHVVLQRLVGAVLEEQLGLLLVDVQAQVAELAALQRADQRRGVDQRAASGVDQHGAALHPRQAVAVDQVAGGRVQRAVQAEDVALGEQGIEVRVLAAEGGQRGVGLRVDQQHAAAEAEHDAREHRADLPAADHPDGLAVQVESGQAVQREVAFAGAVEGAVDAPVQRQDQRHRMFGHRVRRVGRHPHHRQVEGRGGGQVDMVVAGRAQGDQPGAALLEAGEHRRRQLVVDEGADHLAAGGQGGGFVVQARVEKVQVVAVTGIGGGEAVAVVGLAAVQGDAHGQSSRIRWAVAGRRGPDARWRRPARRGRRWPVPAA